MDLLPWWDMRFAIILSRMVPSRPEAMRAVPHILIRCPNLNELRTTGSEEVWSNTLSRSDQVIAVLRNQFLSDLAISSANTPGSYIFEPTSNSEVLNPQENPPDFKAFRTERTSVLLQPMGKMEAPSDVSVSQYICV